MKNGRHESGMEETHRIASRYIHQYGMNKGVSAGSAA